MSKEKAAHIANSENTSDKGGKCKKYEKWTKKELYDNTQIVVIEGRSDIDKEERIEALRNH